VPKPYPQEFRGDVVRVARQRGSGVTLEAIAADFGAHATTLNGWLRQADIGDGGLSLTVADLVAGLR
jgi:transposase